MQTLKSKQKRLFKAPFPAQEEDWTAQQYPVCSCRRRSFRAVRAGPHPGSAGEGDTSDGSREGSALRAGIGLSIIHSFASQQERGPGMLGATRPCVPRAGRARSPSCRLETQLAAAPPSRVSHFWRRARLRPAEEQQPGAAVEVFARGFPQPIRPGLDVQHKAGEGKRRWGEGTLQRALPGARVNETPPISRPRNVVSLLHLQANHRKTAFAPGESRPVNNDAAVLIRASLVSPQLTDSC